MARVGTLIQLLRSKNWAALRIALERSTFPKWLFFVNRLAFCRMRTLKLPRLKMEHIVVRKAVPDDEPLLHHCRANSKGYGKLFASGDTCYLAVSGDEGVAFGWAETRDLHVSKPNGYTFELGKSGAWTYAVEVNPAYRLKGGLVKLWREMFEDLTQSGVDAIYTSMPEFENEISFKSHTKMGFEVFARFAVYRLLGITVHRVRFTDGRASWGFGAWKGYDPEKRG